MKLRTKKTIAREFLFLTATICVGLIAFLLTYPYNFIRQQQVSNVDQTISEKKIYADSLSSSFDLKNKNQSWLFNRFDSEFDLSNSQYNSKDELWKRTFHLAEADSIKIKWSLEWSQTIVSFLNEIGFTSPESYQEFILSNQINPVDIVKKEEASKLLEDIVILKTERENLKSEILSFREQVSFGIYATYVAAILMFVLRYIFFAIRWSLKTLKQKNE